jgi:hypothetical protein
MCLKFQKDQPTIPCCPIRACHVRRQTDLLAWLGPRPSKSPMYLGPYRRTRPARWAGWFIPTGQLRLGCGSPSPPRSIRLLRSWRRRRFSDLSPARSASGSPWSSRGAIVEDLSLSTRLLSSSVPTEVISPLWGLDWLGHVKVREVASWPSIGARNSRSTRATCWSTLLVGYVNQPAAVLSSESLLILLAFGIY